MPIFGLPPFCHTEIPQGRARQVCSYCFRGLPDVVGVQDAKAFGLDGRGQAIGIPLKCSDKLAASSDIALLAHVPAAAEQDAVQKGKERRYSHRPQWVIHEGMHEDEREGEGYAP